MPPKRSGSRSASSTASSSTSESGSSSSSGSGSSGSSSSDSSSDSDSSESENSQASKRRASSALSSASSETESPQKSGSKSQKSAKKSGVVTRSRSASSATSTDSEESPKKSHKDAKKSSGSKKEAAPRAVPKKSATAKPISKASTAAKKQPSDDSDSDFGAFSLPKLAAKAIQAKRASEAAAAASLSPASQPSPSTKSVSGGSILQPSKLAATVSSLASKNATDTSASKSSLKVLTSTPSTSSVDKSKIKSIFSESSTGSSASSSSETEITTKTPTSAPSTTAGKSKAKKGGAALVAAATSRKKRSPSPPKLSPQKKTPSPTKTPGKRGRPVGSGSKKTTSLGAAAVASLAAHATASANRLQTKKKPPPKKKIVSASSASSATSSSDSSDSSSEEISNRKPNSKASAADKKAVSAGRKKKDSNDSKSKKTGVQKSSLGLSTDSEGGKVVARTTRTTRGANVRKSRHLTGKNVSDSDSDAEVSMPGKSKASTVYGLTQGGTVSSAKKKMVEFPPVRKEIPGLQPMEKRMCPMQGCDSSGHLGGRMDRHFLLESCPIYHNMTRKACRDFRSDTAKRANARQKALTSLATKSPQSSVTSDQKKNIQMILEARSRFREEDIPVTDDMPEDCEPDLNGFTSEWDLQIFREAQADTSEVTEQNMRGLPDTKQTRYIEMGSCEMEVWYQSPYPDDFGTLPKLYICEFCLKYHRSATQLKRHAAKCVWNHPPGDEIYRKEAISVFEICGKRYKQYCQSLCLLAKFFLDHKTLYFDVEPFLFYVMTTADSAGCHIVGYFSKEKNSVLNYNVSCILTLPPYQRQGYGRLLIDFSYLLSRAEGKVGSPEKPLSDLGLITYRAYWKDVILEYICNYPDKEISIKAFSEEMGINPNDIISTLQYMGMIKYWKGQHVILKRQDLINDYLEKSRNRPKGRQIYPSALKWKPYQPSAKERKQAEQIKKNQEKQKKR